MIIKSKGYKNSGSIQSVIRYVLQETKREVAETNPYLLTRFMAPTSPEGQIIERFKKNEQTRIHKRKNANIIYQEILSFHQQDSDKLSPSDLREIVSTYVELRCPNSISLAVYHNDKEHLHIHLVFSGVEYSTGRSTRISQAEFNSIKLKMEYFQQHRFNLLHSHVDHQYSADYSEVRQNLKNQIKGQTSKQFLRSTIDQISNRSTTLSQWMQRLQTNGIVPYYRNEKLTGVIYQKRKYRLSTLRVRLDIIQQLIIKEQELEVQQQRMLDLTHKPKNTQLIHRYEY